MFLKKAPIATILLSAALAATLRPFLPTRTQGVFATTFNALQPLRKLFPVMKKFLGFEYEQQHLEKGFAFVFEWKKGVR